MEIQTLTQVQTLDSHRTLQYCRVAPGFFAFRDEFNCAGVPQLSAGLAPHIPAKSAAEGVARLEDIRAHLEHGAALVAMENVFFLDADKQAAAGREGFEALGDCELHRALTPFTSVTQGECDADHLCVVDPDAKMLFTLAGEVIQTGVRFGDPASMMTTEFFDLELDLEVLKRNPRVHFHPQGGGEPRVQCFSRANSYPAHYVLHFVFEPTFSQANRMWAWHKAKATPGAAYSPQEAALALDVLGLRLAGAERAEVDA
ncbi:MULTISPECIES: hypothetical protein [unclassified Variovorax]|uniref:hypothetical protein n=1 Tax=unclassified Variovorax TaxID=663243 RepID=UPI00076CA682|nr:MULTISPECIES: hypothetical protein [unclassified Variovorax]KWT98118.1 hypothetical protein APY03_0789 [Variovorax sp. WDL1]PNG50407.1 hypothetical protein CHC06_06031 [Variovorax sp. B2]PNG51280.1 hypothetical protein CHC07_05937 [Variovorax sp. B4]VTV17529.1 hypothetical protein WDL1P1_00461 [Variovorax sp. WDL1]